MVYLPHWPIPSTLGNRKINYETVFERMLSVLAKIKNPHLSLPPVIHVSGTNGKGSTTSLIAKIFSEAGYKTHIYTSPHLHACNERIMLDCEKISDAFLFEVMEEARIAATSGNAEIPLTFMEGFTIGAFLAFSKIPADILIMECGMGGRIDATNILEKKLASVITPISFDHTEYLGNSIERIALEKAMIMRKETPLILAPQPSQAKGIIDILAQDQGIVTYSYEEEYDIVMDDESGKFDFFFEEIFIKDLPKPTLAGSHQYFNFATALATIFAIKKGNPDLFQIKESHIRRAISNVYWPSRIEKINNRLNHFLQNEQSEIWIDGAHNESGAFALARWITEEDTKNQKRNFVIVGFSRGKCRKEFLEKFKNVAEVLAVRVNGEPYPENPEIISDIGKTIDMKIPAFSNLADALSYIAEINDGNASRSVICGSLHLARDVHQLGNL